MPGSVRVVIVSRDLWFRRDLRSLLGPAAHVSLVGEAEDAASAAVVCALGRPDIVILDALLPRSEAGEVARRIGANRPTTRVLTYRRAEDHLSRFVAR
jgi:DNA-binding NarL/FixJ family response regulator